MVLFTCEDVCAFHTCGASNFLHGAIVRQFNYFDIARHWNLSCGKNGGGIAFNMRVWHKSRIFEISCLCVEKINL